ncbi:unnamed protein product [Camellia sinensis]
MIVSEILSSGEAQHDHGCSREEKDHLVRSTKKIKSTSELSDNVMEV